MVLSGGAGIFQQYKATTERTLIFEHEQQRDTRRAYLLSGDLGDQVGSGPNFSHVKGFTGLEIRSGLGLGLG